MNPNAAIKRLGTPIQGVAVKNAKLYLEKLRSNDWAAVDAMKSRSSMPTIGEIVDEHHKLVTELELQPISVTSRANALLNVISVARNCSKEKARDIPITLLNSDLIAAYWKALGSENRTTAASRLNKAQAIFSARALEMYKRRWRLPDLNAFRTAPKLRRRISDQTFLERRGKWVLAVIDRPEQPFLTKAGVQRWLELSEELAEEFRSEIGTNRYLTAGRLSYGITYPEDRSPCTSFESTPALGLLPSMDCMPLRSFWGMQQSQQQRSTMQLT